MARVVRSIEAAPVSPPAHLTAGSRGYSQGSKGNPLSPRPGRQHLAAMGVEQSKIMGEFEELQQCCSVRRDDGAGLEITPPIPQIHSSPLAGQTRKQTNPCRNQDTGGDITPIVAMRWNSCRRIPIGLHRRARRHLFGPAVPKEFGSICVSDGLISLGGGAQGRKAFGEGRPKVSKVEQALRGGDWS